MAEITDFNEVRKKRQRKRMIRGIILVAAILLVTFVLSYFMNHDPYGGPKSFFQQFQSGSGYPVDAPGGKTKGMYSLDGLLVVVNDTDLLMYNNRGGKVFEVKHQMASPQINIEGDMMLMVDEGSKSYALYRKNTPIVDSKTDRVIYTGAVSLKGGFAIATRSDDYLSQVSVYGRNNQVRYTWNYSDKIITNLALSPSGDRLAVCAIFTQDGIIKTEMLLYYKGDLVGQRVFEDAFVCSLDFTDETSIQGITDRGTFLCTDKGKLLGEFDYKSEPLAAFHNSAQAVVLLLGDYRQMSGYEMVILNSNMTKRASTQINGTIHKLKADGKNAYVLAGNHYYQIDLATGKHLVEEKSEYLYDMQPIGRSIYAITNDQIVRMQQVQSDDRVTHGDIVPDHEEPGNIQEQPPSEGDVPKEEPSDGEGNVQEEPSDEDTTQKEETSDKEGDMQEEPSNEGSSAPEEAPSNAEGENAPTVPPTDSSGISPQDPGL